MQNIHFIDLSCVQQKLNNYEYQRLHEFIFDVGKIFENARYCNDKYSSIWKCADILEKQFREQLQLIKEEIGRRAVVDEDNHLE
jgi:hypothetical protein